MKTPELVLPAGVSLIAGDTREQVANQLARDVAQHLNEAASLKERVLLVLSGGRTPLPFLTALRDMAVPWEQVDVTLADERWVPEDHPDSNTGLIRTHLLQGKASAARWVPMVNEAETPEEGVEAIEESLSDLQWPIDVLVLGMGNDGHTASLFPDAETLPQAFQKAGDRRCAAIRPTRAPHPRITLTWPVLNRAVFTALHLSGDDKLKTLHEVLENPQEWNAMPVRAFFKPGLAIYWSA